MEISRRNFIKLGGISIVTTDAFVNNYFKSGKGKQELQNMVKNVKPVVYEDYVQRLEKAQYHMNRQNIDALFLTGGTNLVYFTGVNWWRSERVFGVLIFSEGDPIWVCPGFELERAKEQVKFGNDIRTWEEHENPYVLIRGALKDRSLLSGTIAVEESVRNFVVHELRQVLPTVSFEDGRLVTQECRVIKTDKEIGYMDLANKITKLAYKYGFERFREGMTPGELSGIIREAHTKMGVSGSGGPSFGLNSAFPHGSIHRRNLGSGDIVLVDGGCSVEGFRSDVTRTTVFGTPSDKQRKVWDIVRKAQLEAHNTIKPGVACEDIDLAARKVIEEAGYGPGYKYFSHRLGHGIGMDGHEYSYLVKGNKLKLKQGMTFSNEPGIYIYGEFGVRIEDCFVVTEDGAHILGGMESMDIEKPFG